MMVEGNSSYRVYRNLATYNASTGSSNGAFVINTKQAWNSACMFRVKIEGYFYDETAPFEMTVGGYIYVNDGFYNYGYINQGAKELRVRFAKNTSTNTLAILLGEEGASYSYPKLTVTSFMQGHSNINEAYAQGWTISQETSLSGYAFAIDVPDKSWNATKDMRNVSSYQVSGMAGGKTYQVCVYGRTQNRGTGNTTMYGPDIRNSSGTVLVKAPNITINWHDGQAPMSHCFVLVAPSNGIIRGYTDGQTASYMTVVQLD